MAGDQGAPGPAIYNNAFLIFMMAHGIVAVSIVTALMPRMSAAAAEGRLADLADQLSLGTRLTAVILVPATVAYVVLGPAAGSHAVRVGRATRHAAALATGWVIAVAGLGLVPFAISQLQIFAFYALSDTRTARPDQCSGRRLPVGHGGRCWLLLPAGGIVAGLMGGSAISFVGSGGRLLAAAPARSASSDLARDQLTMIKLTIAAAAGGAAAWLAVHMLTNMTRRRQGGECPAAHRRRIWCW